MADFVKRGVLLPLLLCCLHRVSISQFQGGIQQPKTNPNTNSIPIMEFQGDGYASAETWATYNGSVTTDQISFTVCHRIQLWYQRPRMYLFTYAFSDEEANELFSEFHLGRLAFRMCKRGTQYCGYHREMPDYYEWRHICVTYDGFKDIYKVFIDGEKVESGSWSGEKTVDLVRSKGVNYLGQDQDNFGGGFSSKQSWSGLISQFNWWDFALEDFFIENAAECRSDLLGNVQEWTEEKWILNKITLQNVPLFELCGTADEASNSYFLFPNKFNYFFYTAWCNNMGGAIIFPTTDEHYHEIMDIAESIVNKDIHEKCIHASGSLIIWAGPSDEWEEGVWVNPYTKDPTAGSFWEVGEPSGGTGENCIRTYIDRKWGNKGCDEANCALCYFPQRMNLSMRGLCASETKIMEGFFDMFYFLKGFVNLKPHWRGLGKSHVYFRPRRQTWRLESYYDLQRYAEFAAEDSNPYDYYPTGRSTWFINQGICQKSGLVTYHMTLSNCIFNDGSGYDFTCTDGTCVNINKRCDLVDNCPDGSDEKDCDILSLDDDYRSEIFPITETGEPVNVALNVTILAFPLISTLELSFLADFVLLMKWADPRLVFANLRDKIELNSLSLKLQTSIWTPTLSFPNARQAEGTVVDSGSGSKVLKQGVPLSDDFSQAVEATMYKGSDSPIIMQREYYVIFNCDYELTMYPFDTQICKIELEVNGIPDKYLTLSIEVPEDCDTCDGATYLGNRALVEYIVGDSGMEQITNSTSKLGKAVVKTIFKRRFIYHLVTVFIQSVNLILVAYLTFYFKLSNFQDRVMIAITTMMVVATMQSSINKMVPKTSYLKMIDYWLLYSFNIMIVIMGVHTWMDSSITRDSVTGRAINPRLNPEKDDDDGGESAELSFFGDNPGWDKGWVKAYRINMMGQVLNILFFVVFNIIFWVIALNHYYTEVDLKTHQEEK